MFKLYMYIFEYLQEIVRYSFPKRRKRGKLFDKSHKVTNIKWDYKFCDTIRSWTKLNLLQYHKEVYSAHALILGFTAN